MNRQPSNASGMRNADKVPTAISTRLRSLRSGFVSLLRGVSDICPWRHQRQRRLARVAGRRRSRAEEIDSLEAQLAEAVQALQAEAPAMKYMAGMRRSDGRGEKKRKVTAATAKGVRGMCRSRR
jgi:hypothetical protein